MYKKTPKCLQLLQVHMKKLVFFSVFNSVYSKYETRSHMLCVIFILPWQFQFPLILMVQANTAWKKLTKLCNTTLDGRSTQTYSKKMFQTVITGNWDWILTQTKFGSRKSILPVKMSPKIDSNLIFIRFYDKMILAAIMITSFSFFTTKHFFKSDSNNICDLKDAWSFKS